jgi:copper chaperone CopZ
LLGNPISVHVKGLVCPSCAIGIKRHLMKTKKVDTIKFDVHKQYTYITILKNKKLSDAEIKTAIENAGYELGNRGIQRQTSKK